MNPLKVARFLLSFGSSLHWKVVQKGNSTKHVASQENAKLENSCASLSISLIKSPRLLVLFTLMTFASGFQFLHNDKNK